MLCSVRILKKNHIFSSLFVLKIFICMRSLKKNTSIHDEKKVINFFEIALLFKTLSPKFRPSFCSRHSFSSLSGTTWGGPSGISEVKNVVIKDQADAINPGLWIKIIHLHSYLLHFLIFKPIIHKTPFQTKQETYS